VLRKSGNLIPLRVCILSSLITDHDQSLSSWPSGCR
jgi:hypothetical protein